MNSKCLRNVRVRGPRTEAQKAYIEIFCMHNPLCNKDGDFGFDGFWCRLGEITLANSVSKLKTIKELVE